MIADAVAHAAGDMPIVAQIICAALLTLAAAILIRAWSL